MIRTNISGVIFESCIYNASGPRCGTMEALEKIGEKEFSGGITSKSCTMVSQLGNPLPRSINHIDLGNGIIGSMNSEGLPNKGIDYYISDELLNRISKYGKPYVVSISGLCLDDNIKMLESVLSKPDVSMIEINLACPNIPGKPMIAYDFEQMEHVLSKLCSIKTFENKPVGVKLAPYFDMPHYQKVVNILSKFPIKFITTINSIGNALFIDADKECACIAPRGYGYAGLGGGYVKQIALANVKILSDLLVESGRGDIDIIGVGGVFTGEDAFEFILCGAKAVQVGTCHWSEGPECFNRIAKELVSIMKKKGYSSIEDFRGKIKPYQKGAKFNRPQVKNDNGNYHQMQFTDIWNNFVSNHGTYLIPAILAFVAILLLEKHFLNSKLVDIFV